MNKPLYAVYYKHVLAAKPGTDGGAAVFFKWEDAQAFADKMNESMQGYFVTKLTYKTEKEKV